MSQEGFQKALARLVTDASYREALEHHQANLQKDFDLSEDEMSLIGQIGQASGAVKGDVSGYMSLYCCCCCCCC